MGASPCSCSGLCHGFREAEQVGRTCFGSGGNSGLIGSGRLLLLGTASCKHIWRQRGLQSSAGNPGGLRGQGRYSSLREPPQTCTPSLPVRRDLFFPGDICFPRKRAKMRNSGSFECEIFICWLSPELRVTPGRNLGRLISSLLGNGKQRGGVL